MANQSITNWTVLDIPSQKGKLAIITGATGGLGFETSLALARAGAEVIVTGRDRLKGKAALDKINRLARAPQVGFEMLDLASLASVHAFADRMVAAGRPVDLLINNAGVMALPKRQLTADGYEMQFGTNHLGHFALTAQLMPLLMAAPAGRVVNVSSLAHRGGTIDFENLQAQRSYAPWFAYQQSKLANLLFTFELQRRSDALDWGITTNAAHPGYALTDLIANGPGSGGIRGTITRLLRPLSHSAAAGALPTLFAATSHSASPTGYYGPDGFYELKGSPAVAKVAPLAKSQAVARKLWEVSEQLTGVKWPGARAANSGTQNEAEFRTDLEPAHH